LAADVDATKQAGLFPLPRFDEFKELESVKRLYDIETVEATYADKPSIVENAKSIGEDLEAMKSGAKKEVVEHLIVVFLEVQQIRSTANPSSSSATSSLVPDPADGAAYTANEIDDFLLRAISVVKCSHCCQVDVFPCLLAHSYYSGGQSLPSFNPASYRVNTDLAEAALTIVEHTDKPLNVPAAEMDELGRSISCVGTRCNDTESIAMPWWLAVRLFAFLGVPFVDFR